jgi:phage gp16-like protein
MDLRDEIKKMEEAADEKIAARELTVEELRKVSGGFQQEVEQVIVKDANAENDKK